MIPREQSPRQPAAYSPRIRGDDPATCWLCLPWRPILPVFAGMIPSLAMLVLLARNSPRIRGDDPGGYTGDNQAYRFSPYSRG